MTCLFQRFVVAALAIGFTDHAVAQIMPAPSVGQRQSAFAEQADLPAGKTFALRVDSSVQHASNVTLAANSSAETSVTGIDIAPGFAASVASDSLRGAIDYSLVAHYWNDSDYNDLSHQLSANGQWLAVPEWFRIDANASYTDVMIDPNGGLNYGNIGVFGQSNLSEVGTASVRPTLKHRFGDYELLANYSYGQVWYLDEGKGSAVAGPAGNQNSKDHSGRLTFGSSDPDAQRLFWQVHADWQKSEFENALPYEFEQAGLQAGYRFSRTLALLGDVGGETDLNTSLTSAGLESTYWNAGLRWDPSERTSAEVRVGERFFGNNYSFSLEHRARFLSVNASYMEGPTTETRSISLAGFVPGNLPAALPDGTFGRLNSAPYVSKEARLGIVAVGVRTSVGVEAFQNKRAYIGAAALNSETGNGARLSVTRRLGSNLSAQLGVDYLDYGRGASSANSSGLSNNYRDLQIAASLNKRAGLQLTLGGEAGYFLRSGDVRYDGWWVALRARWTRGARANR